MKAYDNVNEHRDISNMSGTSHLAIRTLEGNMKISHGDWIIRGIKGEYYPCKHDIFIATYDAFIPKDVINAQEYIQECEQDMGFMAHLNIDRQKKIVDAYFEPIRQKEKEDLEKMKYIKLKSKYEDS